MASALANVTAPKAARSVTVVSQWGTPPPPPSDRASEPSHFAADLGKKFQVSVELDPPKGTNPAKILEGARLCKARGADAVNIGDSPMARVRMSAVAIAALIEREEK